MGQERRRDQVRACGRARIRGIVAVEREPITELPSGSPDQIRTRSPARIIDPRAHARILALEHATVAVGEVHRPGKDRKSTRLNSSHSQISYAVFCLKKKKTKTSKES